MSANFTPTLVGYSGVRPFRFWCQKVLPLVYDDSLSYYELLNKVVKYLNDVISDLTGTEENVQALYNAFVQLQDYVNGYLTDEKMQELVNNRLDEMVEDGTLIAILNGAELQDVYGTFKNIFAGRSESSDLELRPSGIEFIRKANEYRTEARFKVGENELEMDLADDPEYPESLSQHVSIGYNGYFNLSADDNGDLQSIFKVNPTTKMTECEDIKTKDYQMTLKDIIRGVSGMSSGSGTDEYGLSYNEWYNNLTKLGRIKIGGTTTSLIPSRADYVQLFELPSSPSGANPWPTHQVAKWVHINGRYTGQLMVKTDGTVHIGYTHAVDSSDAVDIPANVTFLIDETFFN